MNDKQTEILNNLTALGAAPAELELLNLMFKEDDLGHSLYNKGVNFADSNMLGVGTMVIDNAAAGIKKLTTYLSKGRKGKPPEFAPVSDKMPWIKTMAAL